MMAKSSKSKKPSKTVDKESIETGNWRKGKSKIVTDLESSEVLAIRQAKLDEEASRILEPNHWAVLEEISKQDDGFYTQEVLANLLNISPRTLGRLVKVLLEGRYVKRPPGRKQGLAIDDRGIAVLYRNPNRPRGRMEVTIVGCSCGKATAKIRFGLAVCERLESRWEICSDRRCRVTRSILQPSGDHHGHFEPRTTDAE